MSSLPMTVALLLGSAVVIYLACEYFVNGVEWVGEKFDVGQKATGTILAAFGTALPESTVTLVAVVFGTKAAAKELGVGAALGGPLALSTVAYATVGIVLLLAGKRLPATPEIAHTFRQLSTDQGWFLAIFAAKITLGVLAFAGKPWLGILFLVAYGFYVRHELGGEGDEADEGLEPLKFQPRRAVPATAIALFQTIAALVVIFASSHTFVAQLEKLGPALGLRPQLAGAPVAGFVTAMHISPLSSARRELTIVAAPPQGSPPRRRFAEEEGNWADAVVDCFRRRSALDPPSATRGLKRYSQPYGR